MTRPGASLGLFLLAVALAAPVWFAAEHASPVEAATASGDPVVAAAGDIACDPANANFNGGLGTSQNCRQKYTSDLLVDAGLAAVLLLGDNQYYCGGYQAFLQSYDLSWGRIKSITKPAVGNHEYLTSGGTDCDAANQGAAGYFRYFGAAAGDPDKGYYSYDIGTWHVIVLNSSCSDAGGCGPSSPQGQWLRSELATHTNFCTMAYWHVPVFSSGGRADATYRTFWDALYAGDADLVLAGHDHLYERFAPQRPDGTLDAARGLREFVVGSGGANHTFFTSTIWPNSEARNDTTYGVLKLTLRPTSYDWQFVSEAGGTYADSGTGQCHGLSSDTTPPSTPGGFAATATAPTQIALTWSASTDNVGIGGYRVTRDGAMLATVTGTSYADSTVLPGTTHAYSVVAVDAGGNVSTPTPTLSATTPGDATLTFAPSQDTYVQADQPATNFGTSSQLVVDASPVRRALVTFTVSGVGTRRVVSAKLRLRCVDPSNKGGDVHRVASSSWGERTVTWGNQPAVDSATIASLGPVTAGVTYEVDVTALVTGDGTYTIGAGSTSADGAYYSTREGAVAPQLVVTTAAGAPDTTPPTAPSGLAATATGGTRVDLSWTASTDDVAVADYQILRNGVALGSSTTTSYADTTVQPSTTYSYSVVARDPTLNVSAPSNTALVTTPARPAALTFTPTADAYVQSDQPTKSFGTSTQIVADASPTRRAFLRFNVSGVNGRAVQSAKLRLACVDGSPIGGAFHRVADSSWSESSVTWNAQPSADTATLASLGPVAAGTTYEVDVTALVTGDGTYTIAVDSTSADGAYYSTREGGNAPQLVLTVAPDPVFSDGFETGDLSRWSSVTGLAVQQREVFAGSWAAEGSSSGQAASATKQLATGQADLYYRVRFRIIALSGTEAVNLLKFRDASGLAIAELYVTPTRLLGYRNDVLGVSNTSAVSVSAGVWHDAQMRARVNGTSSIVEVWFDGTRVDSLSRSDSLGTTPIGRLQLGENLPNRTYDIAYDSVVADTSFNTAP